MKYLVTYLSMVVVCTNIAAPHFNVERLIKKAKTVKSIQCVNSYVSVVTDAQGACFVVKQFKERPEKKIFVATTIIELVALEIGYKVGIPLNVVHLVPAEVSCPGKKFRIPASVHNCATGIRFDKYKGEKYPHISLYQSDTQGLTREVITSMSYHKDLAALAAFDTFTGNNDRIARNYFYDEATDSFMGIDMGAAFYRDLCKPSQSTIQDLLKGEGAGLTQQELQGLQMYVETLRNLIGCCTPDSVKLMIEEYAQSSGIYTTVVCSPEESDRWNNYLNHCVLMFSLSYKETEKLIELIDMLFQKVL